MNVNKINALIEQHYFDMEIVCIQEACDKLDPGAYWDGSMQCFVEDVYLVDYGPPIHCDSPRDFFNDWRAMGKLVEVLNDLDNSAFFTMQENEDKDGWSAGYKEWEYESGLRWAKAKADHEHLPSAVALSALKYKGIDEKEYA